MYAHARDRTGAGALTREYSTSTSRNLQKNRHIGSPLSPLLQLGLRSTLFNTASFQVYIDG